MSASILVGKGQAAVSLLAGMANRHGLVAGATGTGKTVTLQRLAERFSLLGVPVFLADIKGDLSGLALRGGDNPRVAERAKAMRLPQEEGFVYDGNPVLFWDIAGERGHPVRTTISELGPMLLARQLNLSEVQEGVLDIVFQVADDNGWLLLDLKDLRALLNHVVEISDTLRGRYGTVSRASVGAIQRRLLGLERQGGERLFGEPALTLADLMRTDPAGCGYISILAADQLIHTPALYTSFLLWLLSELFEELPEIGDPDRPRMVLFFDEAHLLFKDAPPVLLNRVEQVTRLIRSKGVGLYFVTQSPLDVPESILGQLGNRIQHALRAYTPRDQKAVRVAAQTFRANPALDTASVITALGVGEALVSTLDAQGVPGIVQQVDVAPPASRIGPATPEERQAILAISPVRGVYDTPVDRVSAYEILQQRAAETGETAGGTDAGLSPSDRLMNEDLRERNRERNRERDGTGGGRPRQGPVEVLATSAMRSLGTQIGRQLVRGLLGSLAGGGSRRRS